jgi:hypothetical protein
MRMPGKPVHLVAASLFLLSGCASVEVLLGYRVRLEKTPIASLEASLPGGLVPGERVPLVVKLVGTDGTPYLTEGAGKGKVLWEDLAVAASVVTVDAKGRVSLPRDPRASEGQTGRLVITIPSQPGLRTEVVVPVRYDHPFRCEFRGRPGFSGTDGSAGMDGSGGSMGSTDPDNPSPGGNGGNGGNGGDGQDGGRGGEGPAVEVRLALRPGPLVMASCEAGRDTFFFLVDPVGGSLTVASRGGAGGSGGRGGRGGRGGGGGMGSPNGSSGSDGLAGRDGWDGASGKDGPVTVVYDPAVKPYLGAIHLPKGPGVVLREAKVGPLW